MVRLSTIALAMIVIAAGAAAAQQPAAPSLAEVARQAEAAKATVKKAKKTYTNADLRHDPRAEAPVAEPPAGYVSASLGKVVPPEEMIERSKDVVDEKMGGRQPEEYWRGRADGIRSQVDKLQSRMAALTKPNEARDNNAGAKARNEAEVARVLQGLTGLLKQWTTFEESAHVANVPAAWLEPAPQFKQ